jgi:hypothetical protein
MYLYRKIVLVLIALSVFGCATLSTRAPTSEVSDVTLPDRIISDFDDTIKISNSPNKFETVLRALFSKKVFPGMAELYDEILRGNTPIAPKLVVVSASPTVLQKKIHKTLDSAGYPPRLLVLRNWGKDESKFDYKLRSLRQELIKPTLLLGDDGESDPEIYEAAQAERPEKVVGIYHRAIKGRKIPANQSHFWTAFEVAYYEHLLGRLDPEAVLRVSRAVLAYKKKFKTVIPDFMSCPDRYPLTCQESGLGELREACSEVRTQVEKLCAKRPRSP